MEDFNWTIGVRDGKANKRKNRTSFKMKDLKNKMSYQRKKPMFQINYSNYQSFSSYLKKILKTSLITSIPEIAASKSWVKKIIKIIVFILCLIGFTYQTLDFLWMYLDYPTVVNVYVTNPYEIEQPAVTICNYNRKRRSFICTLEDNECVFLNPVEFCKIYPQYCPNNDPKKAFTGMAYLNDLLDWEYDWEYTYMESHNETMIDKCKLRLEEKIWDCNKKYKRIPVVDSKGDPNCCFTIESFIGQPDTEAEFYPNTFNLHSQPEEYVMSSIPVMIQVKVHDRRALVNPFSDGFSLEGGMQYTAYVSMQTQELLPAPYDTDCFDYLEMWKENNGTGPLNHLMCVEYCQLNKLLEMDVCIDKNVDYPHESQLCRKNDRTLTSDIVKNCTLECRDACYDHHYEVRYEKIGNMDHTCMENDKWCLKSRIKLTIVFNKFRLSRYVYQPKFASVEMFSYIGGYMGMWLGLSLISLFDLFETICHLLFFPVGRMAMKAKKKSIKPEPVKNAFFGTVY
ncbi:uncharacterized protein NPIL_95841 [Nephila pilipes]|uniref:Uncharacterized protein n=1 Tax=Nephila pilipes TaxID=299642 RepID=A0A8X6K9C1_NEPPI|nr:uncharacterized protein NPIL_95841 [Nephila pilipes]